MDYSHESDTGTGLVASDDVVRDSVGVVDASHRPRSVKPAAFSDNFLRVPIDPTAAGVVRARLFAHRNTTCVRAPLASILLVVCTFSPRYQHTLCARTYFKRRLPVVYRVPVTGTRSSRTGSRYDWLRCDTPTGLRARSLVVVGVKTIKMASMFQRLVIWRSVFLFCWNYKLS